MRQSHPPTMTSRAGTDSRNGWKKAIMTPQAANEIIQCLPRGKTPFRYFPDRYALMLLEHFVAQGKPVREIKTSPFSRLLGRGPIKEIVASLGSGVLTGDRLAAAWPQDHECYLLTLGEWGLPNARRWDSYYQTTRRGINLVLQLNFSSKHNAPYYQLVHPEERHPFQFSLHPIARQGYHTLAWARLDVELDSGEALIEEVQSDWVRYASWIGTAAQQAIRGEEGRDRHFARYRLRRLSCGPEAVVHYVEDVLKPHLRMWDEAMLAATLWFLRDELGIHRVFYHTFESGNCLKGLSGSLPPRSLYTSLPQRFCFQETNAMPSFLHKGESRRFDAIVKRTALRFFRLEL